jgi:proteasome lid subunit RPN8/RPN11
MSDGRPVRGLAGVAERQIYDHCFENPSREVGGVLVGHATDHGPVVVGSVRAENADESLTALTFTQDSWAYIHQVRERDYGDFAIVGWYHSHPGHGIFLSDQDLFIHKNFFSGESQIAYVVDPVAGQEGVFGWSNGEVVRWFRGATSRHPEPPRHVARPRDVERPDAGRSRPTTPGSRSGRPAALTPAARRTPARTANTSLRLDAGIYWAIIGVAAGVSFWALFLR